MLVSPRTTFAQIRKLGYKRAQLGLTGTIINVPVDLDKIQSMYPRNLDSTTTISIMLKMKLEYRNTFLAGNIHSKLVVTALTDLYKTKLYKYEGIVVNQDWEKIFNKTIEQDVLHTLSPLRKTETYENEDDIEMISETLIHGYGETNLLDDLSNKILEITPS